MKNYCLDNGAIVSLDFQSATVQRITYKNNNIAIGNAPFFCVKLRDRSGQSLFVSATECVFTDENKGVAHYKHQFIDVSIIIKKSGNNLVWRANVVNKSNRLIEQVELMSFGVHDKLQDEQNGKGAILFPWNEGALVTNMKKREQNPFPYIEPEYPSLGKYAIFPNMICSQFLAYLVNGVGVYVGMHDKERTTKHIDFCYANNVIKLQMRTFCDVDYGQSYEMPFDCVMSVFDGEWQDACNIYRNWFEKNLPKGLCKIEENSKLPSWYGNSPIIVTYPIRGKFDTDVMNPNGLYPYKNALPYLSEIANATCSQTMALLMHWEGTAPWAPPYVWPPYGGVEDFTDFVNTAHKKDMLVGLYCSGMGWTQRSNIYDYNCEQKFHDLGIDKIVCTNTDGSFQSKICREQRFGYDLCPSNDKTKQLIVDEAQKMIKSGVDYVQLFDQNHGGSSYFCYSDKHGHVPAPGKRQVEHTAKLIDRIQAKGVLLGCESAAAEPFISKLKFSDNRYELTYYVGKAIPVYAYLYHEYVNNFMGNQICMMLSREEYNYTFRLAYSFIAGDMLTAVITDKGEISLAWGNDCFKYVADKNVALKALKNFNGWRTGIGKDYLHKGKMVKPIKLHCGTKSFVGDDGIPIIVDEVLTSAYEYENKSVQFCANYTLNDVVVTVDEPVSLYVDSTNVSNIIDGVKAFTIPALSAVMIQSKKDILT